MPKGKKKITKKDSPKKSPAKEAEGSATKTRSIRTPGLLRGMKDILPKDGPYWYKVWDVIRNVTTAYGYDYVETPILEESTLFTRSLGRGTDLIDKEMYVFEDKDGTKVALRPEGTAPIARAYVGHGMHSYPQPVKVWHTGSMFRHDRPQAGRYRQFHQFDCDVLGERDPVIDAELIVMAYNVLRDLGLPIHVNVNSIGTLEDRERYQIELVGYLRSKRSYLSDESKKRINRNPLRVLDSKDEQDRSVIEEAPQILDWLGDEPKNYLMKVLEYLDELQVPYMLKPTLVRGLDYYTDTVFEIFQEGEEGASQSALGGGGRYDGLIEAIGGRPTPGCGFALGLERVVSALRRQAQETEEAMTEGPKIFFAQLGAQARQRALGIIEEMRREGIFMRHNIAKASLKSQLELANKYGATHTFILGQKEMQDGTIIVRDMDSGNQEIIDQKKIKNEILKLTKI